MGIDPTPPTIEAVVENLRKAFKRVRLWLEGRPLGSLHEFDGGPEAVKDGGSNAQYFAQELLFPDETNPLALATWKAVELVWEKTVPREMKWPTLLRQLDTQQPDLTMMLYNDTIKALLGPHERGRHETSVPPSGPAMRPHEPMPAHVKGTPHRNGEWSWPVD